MFLKEESEKKRPCINYIRLNQSTVKRNLPLPNKESMIAKFAGGDFYIALDAKAAYNQVPVAKESQKYLVFSLPGIDGRPRYFYPTRSNFGTSNMPGEFQRISGNLFDGEDSSVYIDDVTIKGYAGKEREALAKLRKVLQSAKDNNVKFAFKKAQFFKKEIKMLGELISKRGRRPNPLYTDRGNRYGLGYGSPGLSGRSGLVGNGLEHVPEAGVAVMSSLVKFREEKFLAKILHFFEFFFEISCCFCTFSHARNNTHFSKYNQSQARITLRLN